jgi:epoxyqueuosine reductase
VRRSDADRALPDRREESLGDDIVAELRSIAAAHGVTRAGVASAEVMHRARAEIVRRRDAGLHDGMKFTYKNPERSTDPGRAVEGARSVFVGALPYLLDDAVGSAGGMSVASDGVAARVARYAWTDHYAPLRAGLWAVAHRLRRDGWRAVAFADDNSMVDREIAYRAGLGWFGKNANLLVEGAGSYFVLGSVVTDAPLPLTDRMAPDGCGSCRRCIDGCPTGAIIDSGVIDASKCLAWLLQKPGTFPREYRRALGDRIYGCDECQEVCPPTVRLGPRRAAGDVAAAAVVEPVIDALGLLEADDETILLRWGRWYLTDREPRWHRRNALVVVGNAGLGVDRGAAARIDRALARYLAHDDPILRAHAVWAARMLGRDDLVPATDVDADVRAELSAPL